MVFSPGKNESIAIRRQATRLALVAAALLTFGKLAAGYITGSVAMISEGVHSLLDLTSAMIAFYTVIEAIKPADIDHPFGHGKFETLSSFVEALLLGAAAAWMAKEGLQRLQAPVPLQKDWIAIAVMAVSIVLSYAVFLHNRKAAASADSLAIRVNAIHFFVDVLTSIAILFGLLAMKFFGWPWMDPVLALGVAAYVFWAAGGQIRVAMGELLDERLPREEVRVIESILDRPRNHAFGAHELKTRKGGSVRYIDFHLEVCGRATVNESHAICDQVEDEIMDVFPGSSINIHVEPCNNHNRRCVRSCVLKKGKPA